MTKLTTRQIITAGIIVLIIAYFLTGVIDIAVNKAMKQFFSIWSWDFTVQAIINGYPKIWLSLLSAITLGALIGFGPVFIPKPESLYGDARFANSVEVKKMDLYGGKGIIIGKFNGKLLRFGGQQFVSLGAPTRSGKGVGIVIPNLLDWNESAVVQDIKQECFNYTSKYREQELGQEVYLFNPFDRTTHRYNPLGYIDINGENADSDLNDFAEILYPTSSATNDTSLFFAQQAQNLFIGLCYLMNDLLTNQKALGMLKYYNIEYDFTLFGILSLSRGFGKTIKIDEGDEEREIPTTNFKNTYDYLMECELVGQKAQAKLADYLGIDSDNTRSGVEGSFKAPLMKFGGDDLRLATSANDFDLRDLRKKRMTIYIGIKPDKLTSAKQILNIFWQQLLLINTKTLPDEDASIKYKALLVMDEFTAPGELSIYRQAISFIAGFWLRSLMIYQTDSQLKEPSPKGYGQEGAKTLLQNHACQIYYTPRGEDAENISKLLGEKTVKNKSKSFGKGGGGGSESNAARRLMLAQELQEMPFENEIIKIDNGKPIYANKAFYYSDPFFMDKFKKVSKSLAKVKGIPNRHQLESAIQGGETRIDVPRQSFEKLRREWLLNLRKAFTAAEQDPEARKNFEAVIENDLKAIDTIENKDVSQGEMQ